MEKKLRPWGEEVWEEKIKRQNELGVIHGGRFSKAKEITDKTREEAIRYLDKNVFPQIKKKGKIMDAGVGPLARFSIEFAKRGYNVLGVDVSTTTIRHAQKHISRQNATGIRLIQDDLTKLNKIHEKFDFIFCYGTFGHIPKILALDTLRNFYSKLNKNGLCLVHLWLEEDSSLKSKLKEAVYMSLHKIGKKMSNSFYVNCSFYSRDELKDLFSYSKFTPINEAKGGFFLLRR